MDLHNQSHTFIMPQHGGYNQSFEDIDLSGYGAGANIVPPAAQLVGWYNQRDATDNGAMISPTNDPRQPAENTNFSSPQQDHPKPPTTQ